MPASRFDFVGPSGKDLSGRLQAPVGTRRGWALLAHGFTGRNGEAAAFTICRSFAEAGIGVLSLEFPNIDGSDADSGGFHDGVENIVSAAAAMAAAGRTPTLLVGHGHGGTAALVAADRLSDIAAVAIIAAPAFHGAGQRRPPRGRPLLLLHSPADRTVALENATKIYIAASNPKSFLSLDGADHLLTNPDDARFAAGMIAAWSCRYLPADSSLAPQSDAEADETGMGRFHLSMRAGKSTFIADEPEGSGGLGSGATPYNLLSAALAACTTMTLRLHAVRRNWPVRHIHTYVSHRRSDGADVFSRRIEIEGSIDSGQKSELAQTAERCPVHRTLTNGVQFEGTEIEIFPEGEE